MRPTGPNAHLWLRDPTKKRLTRPWVLEKLIGEHWVVMAEAMKEGELPKASAFGGETRARKRQKGES